MKRFYFHIKQDGELVTDDEGIDLPGMTEATREALQGARELLAEAIRSGMSKVPEALIVADATGRSLLEVPLLEVLPPNMTKRPEPSCTEQGRQVVKAYADDLREIITKLRKKLQ